MDPAEAAGLFIDNYGLSPKEYAEWRTLQSLQESSIMNQKTLEQISHDISQYMTEWGKREYGDPEKFEMTPEQYAEWRMVQWNSPMNSEASMKMEEDIMQYSKEWTGK